MKKVKVGVLGAFRGKSMIDYCSRADNVELVAICDKYEPALQKVMTWTQWFWQTTRMNTPPLQSAA